jgi:Bacterial antitoxin of ParD toxin-antitoxin type II system and RHH
MRGGGEDVLALDAGVEAIYAGALVGYKTRLGRRHPIIDAVPAHLASGRYRSVDEVLRAALRRLDGDPASDPARLRPQPLRPGDRP